MKRWNGWLLAVSLCISMSACTSTQDHENGGKEVTLILDYVPNTNHTGIYVAQAKGYFEDAGLQVKIIEPGAHETSATLVAVGKGQFGVSYQEDVTYARTASEPLPIRAIATIIQHNTSGFVSLANANIETPKDFEGKVYAGWQSPSEEALIRAVMKQAGADFSKLTMVGADGSGFAAFGKGVDIQWDFAGWALIKGRMDGYDLNYMPLRDLDERLDYYTPVLITNEDMIAHDPQTVRAFLGAVKQGYEFAIAHPEEAARILSDIIPDTDFTFLEASQAYLSKAYQGDAAEWGRMSDEVWDRYTQFMVEYGLIDHYISADAQYTNEFLY
ncbi:MAG: ABC transporter substrate-binding protein [Erysipelotrichaceae bacterium]|nr:ABC transporter substrate-binding protein [Erysipelotrichaceae bacterium]